MQREIPKPADAIIGWLEEKDAEIERLRETLDHLRDRSLLWRDTEFGRYVARVAVEALDGLPEEASANGPR